VETLPVFALGLAALIETVRERVARGVLVPAIGAVTPLAVHNMLAYWLGEIPYDGTTWHTYVRSFGV
jgi:hypothetical protein